MEKGTNWEASRKKAMFEEPCAQVVRFGREDVITTSGPKDPNQGEWDPQNEFSVQERTDN